MNNNLIAPPYFHREYNNDFPRPVDKEESPSQVTRVAKVALPFVALYQPFGRVLAGGLSVTRTWTAFSEISSTKDFREFSWALFNTCLAVAAIAGTIFLHPLGMLMTTLGDIGMNMQEIYQALSQGEILQATKETMRIANNSLYLALMVTGSLELQLASLAIQVLVEGSASYEEFGKDNLLETIGHLGMCMVRMNQSYRQLGILQEQSKIEEKVEPRHLYLECDEDVISLTEDLHQGKISIHAEELTDVGLEELINIFPRVQIVELDLSDNHAFSYEGFSALAKALPQSDLLPIN